MCKLLLEEGADINQRGVVRAEDGYQPHLGREFPARIAATGNCHARLACLVRLSITDMAASLQ